MSTTVVVDAKGVKVEGKEDGAKKKSLFSKEPHKMTLGEKFTKSVNVRLSNYTHATTMATFIAVVTLVGFILLLVSMATSCPIEKSDESNTVYQTGIKEMQREFVNKIMKPDNLEELKAEGVTRKATVCMNRAGIYKLGDHGTKNIDPAAGPIQPYDNGYVELEPCALPDDAGFKADGWAVTWCPGMMEKYNVPTAPPCTLDDGDMKSFTSHITYTISTEKRVCPSAASVIGSGLAYIAYIEMFATFFVGVILIKTGFAKPLHEGASIMGLLKSANSDTSKVEDTIDQLRHDVDDMMQGQNDLDDAQSKQIAALEEKVAILMAKLEE